MIDTTEMERVVSGWQGKTLSVSKNWIIAVIKELKENRSKIAELEAKVAADPFSGFDEQFDRLDKAFEKFDEDSVTETETTHKDGWFTSSVIKKKNKKWFR